MYDEQKTKENYLEILEMIRNSLRQTDYDAYQLSKLHKLIEVFSIIVDKCDESNKY